MGGQRRDRGGPSHVKAWYLHKCYQNKDNVSLSVLNHFYRVMYVRIGVRGTNKDIVIGTRVTRFQDRDKAMSALLRLNL